MTTARHCADGGVGDSRQCGDVQPDLALEAVTVGSDERTRRAEASVVHEHVDAQSCALGEVEQALRGAALWDEVKDKLHSSGLGLSGGQQQRLCIARSVAVQPEVILFDEPCSALDPISTAKVEELIEELAEDYTIAIVTHNMQQAVRVSDYTAFMYLGELVEYGETDDVFNKPKQKRTLDYITGRFG